MTAASCLLIFFFNSKLINSFLSLIEFFNLILWWRFQYNIQEKLKRALLIGSKKIKDISPLIGIKEIFIQNPQAGDCQEGQKRKGKTRTSNSWWILDNFFCNEPFWTKFLLIVQIVVPNNLFVRFPSRQRFCN